MSFHTLQLPDASQTKHLQSSTKDKIISELQHEVERLKLTIQEMATKSRENGSLQRLLSICSKCGEKISRKNSTAQLENLISEFNIEKQKHETLFENHQRSMQTLQDQKCHIKQLKQDCQDKIEFQIHQSEETISSLSEQNNQFQLKIGQLNQENKFLKRQVTRNHDEMDGEVLKFINENQSLKNENDQLKSDFDKINLAYENIKKLNESEKIRLQNMTVLYLRQSELYMRILVKDSDSKITKDDLMKFTKAFPEMTDQLVLDLQLADEKTFQDPSEQLVNDALKSAGQYQQELKQFLKINNINNTVKTKNKLQFNSVNDILEFKLQNIQAQNLELKNEINFLKKLNNKQDKMMSTMTYNTKMLRFENFNEHLMTTQSCAFDPSSSRHMASKSSLLADFRSSKMKKLPFIKSPKMVKLRNRSSRRLFASVDFKNANSKSSLNKTSETEILSIYNIKKEKLRLPKMI